MTQEEVDLQRLEWSVRALSLDASAQMSLYPVFVCVADELVLELDECRNNAWHTVVAQAESILALDRQLENIGGPAHAELWTDRALRLAPEWAEVRELARAAIAELNWPADPPPFERGAIYVGSS